MTFRRWNKKKGSWKFQDQKKSDHALNVPHKSQENFFWAYLNLFQPTPTKKLAQKCTFISCRTDGNFSLCVFPFSSLFFLHVRLFPSYTPTKRIWKSRALIHLSRHEYIWAADRLKQFCRWVGKTLRKTWILSWLHCPFSSFKSCGSVLSRYLCLKTSWNSAN